MAEPQVDYGALMKQAGAFKVTPPTAQATPPAGPDYGALLTANGATDVTAAPAPPSTTDWVIDVAKHVGIGALKGAGDTATNLGEIALHAPVVGRFLQRANTALYGLTPAQQETAFDAAHDALKASTTAETVGKVGEQIAEVVLPSGEISRAALAARDVAAPLLKGVVGETAARLLPRVAVESAASAGLARAQGTSPTVGAVAGAISPAVSELLPASADVAASLKASATKKVVEALGPTKERYKALAERLAPSILQRGLGGSRRALQERAATMLDSVGNEIDAALTAHGGQPIAVQPVRDALESAKDAFRTPKQMSLKDAMAKGYAATTRTGVALTSGAKLLPNGQVEALVEFEPRAIRQLEQLQKVVDDVGPTSTVGQLTAIRRAWDEVVSRAGGYAHRASGAIGVPLSDQSEAWAKREGATQIRQLLAQEVPDLAAVNKEFSFWKGLDDVLTQTLQRTKPHGKGVGRIAAEAAGQAVGGAAGLHAAGPAGAVSGALLVGKVADLAKAAFSSPRWKLVDARTRNAIADAIANGRKAELLSRLGSVVARGATGEAQKLATQEP